MENKHKTNFFGVAKINNKGMKLVIKKGAVSDKF